MVAGGVGRREDDSVVTAKTGVHFNIVDDQGCQCLQAWRIQQIFWNRNLDVHPDVAASTCRPKWSISRRWSTKM